MAMTRQEREALDSHITREQWDQDDNPPVKLFDVTCTIGSVYADGLSPLTPHEAAFVMVANHDAPGTFSWVTPEGYSYSVTVDRKDPAGKDDS